MPTPFTTRLSQLATAIADGESIDWPSLESAASSDEEQRQVGRLKTIAEVAYLHAAGALVDSRLSSVEGLDRAGSIEEAPAYAIGSSWGHLQILDVVGSGRYGVVYRAWDPKLEREVALKLLRHRELPNQTEVVHEARLMARVHHPNVISVYGADTRDGRIGLWMQFVRGRTLEAELAATGPFSGANLMQIARDLCEALSAVHRAGLVHRDVKPQNILRDEDGRVLLGDFGTGGVINQESPGVSGTPLFLAPELLAGGTASERTDIYALGVTLYHLATGAFPIVGRSILNLRDAHERGAQPVRLASMRPDLAGPFAETVDRALAKSPQDRWPTAAALISGLQRSCEASGGSRGGLGSLFGGRGAAQRIALATGALILALVAGAMMFQETRRSRGGTVPQPDARLLIGAFENTTGQPGLDETVGYALDRQLAQAHHVRVTPRATIDDTLRLMKQPPDAELDRATAREVSVRDGRIPTFIVGRIEAPPGGILIHATIVNAADGATVAHLSAHSRGTSGLPDAIAQLSTQIVNALGDALAPTAVRGELEPVTTPSLEALRLYSEAYRLGARGEWTAALELSRQAVLADADFPTARVWLAWCLLRANAPASEYQPVAAEALRRVNQASPWERLWIEGSYQSLTGNDERAISFYEGVLKLQPDHHWAAGNIAIAYGRLGRYADAVPVALRLADIRPHDHRTLNIAFSALRRGGRLNEAALIAARLRTLHQSEQRYWMADAWAFDAYVAWLAGDAAKTRLELDRATAQVLTLEDAAKVSILPELAQLYMALGRPSDARRLLRAVPDVAQRNLHLAILELHAGNASGAREFALQTRVGVNDARNLWERVWVLARSGALKQARALADLARHPSPSNSVMVEATRARGDWMKAAEAEVAFAEGKSGKAIALLNDALPALAADVTVTPSQMYRAADTLAEALTAEGRHAEAAQQLKTVMTRQERATFAGAPLWALRCAVRLEQLSARVGDRALAQELNAIKKRRWAEAEAMASAIR